jgi:hypothetical protein
MGTYCGLAVGIELGSDQTIRPPGKQDVGRRLALVAFEKVYGKAIESSGPPYASMAIAGNRIRVRLSHADGLAATDGPPRNFAIAGAERKFVRAVSDRRLAATGAAAPIRGEPGGATGDGSRHRCHEGASTISPGTASKWLS